MSANRIAISRSLPCANSTRRRPSPGCGFLWPKNRDVLRQTPKQTPNKPVRSRYCLTVSTSALATMPARYPSSGRFQNHPQKRLRRPAREAISASQGAGCGQHQSPLSSATTCQGARLPDTISDYCRQRRQKGGAKPLGRVMTRPRAADDFAAIRARMEEPRRERRERSEPQPAPRGWSR